jgi:hypothetical protein
VVRIEMFEKQLSNPKPSIRHILDEGRIEILPSFSKGLIEASGVISGWRWLYGNVSYWMVIRIVDYFYYHDFHYHQCCEH